jgi:hypothetical protein
MQNRFYWTETLDAAGGTTPTSTSVINLSKLMSSANRKNIPMVDRKGNAQLYTVKLRVYGAEVAALESKCAPNTYVTKNAVKAWHEAREVMVKRAGQKMKDLGPYARHLRPFLNVGHENGTITEITADSKLGGNTHFQGDEYTYTRLAVSTPVEEDLASGANASFRPGNLVDSYSLTVCDSSVDEATTADDPDGSDDEMDQDSFVSVGMIASWLGTFKQQDIGTDATNISPNNALLQLLVDSPSSEEVLELIADAQVEGRPWDGDGSAYRTLTTNGFLSANSNLENEIIVHAPLGLMQIALVNGHSAQDTIGVEIECLAISDM